MANETLGEVVLTYGCGVSDDVVAAVARRARERGEDEAVTTALVEDVRANRYRTLEGRAWIIIETKRGVKCEAVRVEKCSDGRWYGAGN